MSAGSPTVLVILDGLGYSPKKVENPFYSAQKPTFDYFLTTFPHTLLQAAGKAVGLPENSPGNSEVGHMTLGAGRIIQQPLTQISEEFEEGVLQKNPLLTDNLQRLQKEGASLHLIGLVSDGNVHSSIKHLFGYLAIAKKYQLSHVFIHCFLDGRDVAPRSASVYLTELEAKIKELNIGTIASLHGRFYAMDRDNNWQRTQSCYNVLTQEQEISFTNWQTALNFYYEQKIYDEFVPPTQLVRSALIKKNDGIIFFNVRPDRARQLTEAFTYSEFNDFEKTALHLSFFITPVDYSPRCQTTALIKSKIPNNTLLECLSAAHKSIYAIAETEKYAHITYFFNGGKEKPWPQETQILVPSLPLRNYNEHPEMSAATITAHIVDSLKNNPRDFYLVNYANADMVGHSGNFLATVKAIECLDEQLGILYSEVVEKRNGVLYITADHGNAEDKFDPLTKQPRTSHTTNPVYFIEVKKGLEHTSLPSTLIGLSDGAALILKNMNIPVPTEMKI